MAFNDTEKDTLLCAAILEAPSKWAKVLLLPGLSYRRSSCWSCSRTGCCSWPDHRRVPWQSSPGAPSESQLGTESGIETEMTTSLMRSSGCSKKTAPSLVPPSLAQMTARSKSKNLKQKKYKRHSAQIFLPTKQPSDIAGNTKHNKLSHFYRNSQVGRKIFVKHDALLFHTG